MKKAGQDLINRRGDDKTNVSKILYYGALQNLIFNALSQTAFALIPGFDDLKKEENYNSQYIDSSEEEDLIQGDKKWFGAGHNSTYTFDGKDYIIYHAYDAKQNGRPLLQVKQLQWDADLWPLL